jgi:hypothetical protein
MICVIISSSFLLSSSPPPSTFHSMFSCSPLLCLKRFENASEAASFKQPTVVFNMLTPIYDLCLKLQEEEEEKEEEEQVRRKRKRKEEEHDLCISAWAARLCFFVRFALFSHPRRSPFQPLPRLGKFGFLPKLLRRFLRGCVVATAHGLVTAPASVFITTRKKMNMRNCILARVMSGFVMREEVRLQAAAAARIARKHGIVIAARDGDVADVLGYIIAHANCLTVIDDW